MGQENYDAMMEAKKKEQEASSTAKSSPADGVLQSNEPFKMYRSRTVSVTIDTHNDFSDDERAALRVHGANAIVDEIIETQKYGLWKVLSSEDHPADAEWIATPEKPMGTKLDAPDMDQTWPAHCIVGTWGHEQIPGMPAVESYDLVISKGSERDKHPYGPCYKGLQDRTSSGLIEKLREWETENILLDGLVIDRCVGTAAREFREAGFNVVINRAGCAGLNEEDTKKMIEDLTAIGVIFAENAEEIKKMMH